MLANADAGSADAEAIRRARRILEHSSEVEYRETRSKSEIDDVVHDLSDRTLVVVGGDGSLARRCERLASCGRTGFLDTWLIPLGTGNDLARTAGIPREPDAAARVVLHGEPCPHDLLLGSDGVAAVNAVHLGIGLRRCDWRSAKQLLGPPGYPVGAVLAGTRFPGWILDVVVDGRTQPHDGRLLMVGVSLGRTIGGGTKLAPDAEIDDGRADIIVAASTGPVRRVRFATRLRRGHHGELHDVHTSRGKTIEVSGGAVRANTDGEVSEPRVRWQWTLRPRAWRLIHPPVPTSARLVTSEPAPHRLYR